MLERISISKISGITHILIIFLIFFNIGVLILLPHLVKIIIGYEVGSGYQLIIYDPNLYRYFLIILYTSGLIALFILNELRLLFRSCINETPFIRKNVTRLLRIALGTSLITIIFFTKIFMVNSVMTWVIVFVFFMVTIFAFVLSLLFNQAVNFKEENDLTI